MKISSHSSEKSFVAPLSKFVLLVLFMSSSLFGAELRGKVVQLSRELAMKRSGIQTRDYYLNVGSSKGVAVGETFRVYRVKTVTSGLSGEPIDFIQIPLGRLNVIHVGASSAVARLLPASNPEQMPKLEYPVIMVGDHVQRVEINQHQLESVEGPSLEALPLMETQVPESDGPER